MTPGRHYGCGAVEIGFPTMQKIRLYLVFEEKLTNFEAHTQSLLVSGTS